MDICLGIICKILSLKVIVNFLNVKFVILEVVVFVFNFCFVVFKVLFIIFWYCGIWVVVVINEGLVVVFCGWNFLIVWILFVLVIIMVIFCSCFSKFLVICFFFLE